MARPRRAQSGALDELQDRALEALRKAGKPSSEGEGLLELQKPGGPVVFLAKKLRVSEYSARQVYESLSAQGLVSSKGMGPTQPRKTLIAAEDPPKSRPRRAKRTISRRGRPPKQRATARHKRTGQSRARRSPKKRATSVSNEPRSDQKTPVASDVGGLLTQLRTSYDDVVARNQVLQAANDQLQARTIALETQLEQIREILQEAS